MAPTRQLLSRDLPPLFETPDLPGAQIPVPQGHWCLESDADISAASPETQSPPPPSSPASLLPSPSLPPSPSRYPHPRPSPWEQAPAERTRR
ncbi:hypothetical protein [Streptomyces sp. NBC_00338]|uniref:hypothetical protein n=1 Tax=Streptomyces sp. NBC_00338 TaxID=2975715 RepID=UPI00225AB691|nr:hypothetical protein [Streptomyces sp. NBC_00338]MCX5140991.1 hypothetical protein [Streptomyces sp. NBC_00338]